MARTILVAGNWKMHGTTESNKALVEGILDGLPDNACDVSLFPAYPHLGAVRSLTDNSSIRVGAQDLNPHEKGAHTGEVSAEMLVDMGCEQVLVGHSERRQHYGDSNGVVAEKLAMALSSGLEPILCVGETLEDREADETEAVIGTQLDAVLERVGQDCLGQVTIAYEPVWAIGTGETATPDQAQAVHRFIRDKFRSMDVTMADCMRILYGGSVKPGNAADLFAQEDIDGGLIGGAALDADSFLGIIRAGSS